MWAMRIRTIISLMLAEITILLVAYSLAQAISLFAGYASPHPFDSGLSIFIGVWMALTFFTFKLHVKMSDSLRRRYLYILFINSILAAMAPVILYFSESPEYVLLIAYAVTGFATIMELIMASFYFSLKRAKTLQDGYAYGIAPLAVGNTFIPVPREAPITIEGQKVPPDTQKAPTQDHVKQVLIGEAGLEVYQFIASQIDLNNGNHIIFSTTSKFNIERLPGYHFSNLVNLKNINDIRYINKFFETVNLKLPRNGVFIGCLETQEQRKVRLFRKLPPGINVLYYTLDFIIKRVLPKLYITKKLYFYLSKGKNRVISRAEILGRLYCCGFEVINETFLGDRFFFVAKKEKPPTYDLHPTYGPVIKLGRTGKDGKIIKVYKLRTMHPYSEYLQEYVYTHHYLKEGGKFNNDFRISTFGRYLRKFWIDETLMILNLLRGELKLVGVRPLSIHYFNLYSEELQRKRIQFKPGLIPPFYADLPKTLEEIMASEMRYLEQYEKHPFRTDVKYFFLAFYNILFKHSRSN